MEGWCMLLQAAQGLHAADADPVREAAMAAAGGQQFFVAGMGGGHSLRPVAVEQ